MKKLFFRFIVVCLVASTCLNVIACKEPAHQHTYGEWEVQTPATCTAEGVEIRYCTGDKTHFETRPLAEIGHAYGEWTEETPATCTEDGVEKRVCANDTAHFETRPLQATDHDWTEWEIDTPATCTTAGLEKRVCKNNSSHVETRSIEAKGHAYGAWTEVSKPTATTDGLKKRVCANDSTHVDQKVLRTLDGKKIIFIGNSYTYYGNLVYPRTATSYPTLVGRTNDKENFYKLCQSKGATVSVTNWTMDGHGLQDLLGSECGATGKTCVGVNHYANLTDKNYDYVVFQAGSRNAEWAPEKLVEELEKFMVDFKKANPNTKFVFLVQSQAHIVDYTWMPARKTLEEKGVIVVDWGDIVYDIMNGITKVPGSTMTYNKNSFIVAKSVSDGYHPNILSGYITSLMTYCAITGEDAYGSEYSFVHNESSSKYQRNIDLYYNQFYKVGTSNFREIIRSDTEMKGIQKVIDNYLESKPYMNA